MSTIYLERVQLERIHQRYDLDISFNNSLNILYGQNGTGKSTLIHIIANIINCDFLRFQYLDFKKITATYSNKNTVSIQRFELNGTDFISVNSGDEKFIFTPAEAIEALMALEDERSRLEFIPDLIKKQRDFSEQNNLAFIKTSYFPAFRTMLEAWSSQLEDERRPYYSSNRVIGPKKITAFSRNIFGRFLPTINYPSPMDIENNLREEIRDGQIKIGRYESSIFSNSFVKVFSALLNGEEGSVNETEQLLEEISELTKTSLIKEIIEFEGHSQTYRELQNLIGSSKESRDLAGSAVGALKVYRDALKERRNYQASIFSEIDRYFDSVNAFLDPERKQLKYYLDLKRRMPKVGLRFPDGTWSSIKVMSSGERQLLTMLYAVTKMSENSLVLIDEPELSLHIDWQEELLSKMMSQLGGRQIIVCTHSPSIAADYEDHMTEVVPVFSKAEKNSETTNDDDEDLI